jgi:peroxiredoxin
MWKKEDDAMKRRTVGLALTLLALLGLSMPYAVSAVEVGDKAPDFELPSTQGEKLKLSSFQGKKNVLIEFYVLDFTPT